MAYSSLTNVVVPASPSNYTKGRSSKITEICIHHMAGVMTAEQCGKIWQNPNRKGSSNYGIGVDGRIGGYVEEQNTAWCNSNWASNCRSISIETSNDRTGGNWHVSDASLNSLIRLVADIAKRYNFGTLVKGQNVTWHSMYASTTCPGDYLRSKLDYIIAKANEINGGKTPEYTGVITYQAYTNKWLSEVNKADSSYEGYAGIIGKSITGFRCRPQYGELIYKAHTKGGKWLPEVNSKDYYKGNDDSFAGILGKPIDAIKISSTKGYVTFRVHLKNGGWLPWVDSRTQTGTESYAGIYGKEIDAIQMF